MEMDDTVGEILDEPRSISAVIASESNSRSRKGSQRLGLFKENSKAIEERERERHRKEEKAKEKERDRQEKRRQQKEKEKEEKEKEARERDAADKAAAAERKADDVESEKIAAEAEQGKKDTTDPAIAISADTFIPTHDQSREEKRGEGDVVSDGSISVRRTTTQDDVPIPKSSRDRPRSHSRALSGDYPLPSCFALVIIVLQHA